MSQPSKAGSVYIVLYQDDSTGYMFVFYITRKSKALSCFQQVFKTILRDTGRTISTLRTDRGGEFSSTTFLAENSLQAILQNKMLLLKEQIGQLWKGCAAHYITLNYQCLFGLKQLCILSTPLTALVLGFTEIIHHLNSTQVLNPLYHISVPSDVQYSFTSCSTTKETRCQKS